MTVRSTAAKLLTFVDNNGFVAALKLVKSWLNAAVGPKLMWSTAALPTKLVTSLKRVTPVTVTSAAARLLILDKANVLSWDLKVAMSWLKDTLLAKATCLTISLAERFKAVVKSVTPVTVKSEA